MIRLLKSLFILICITGLFSCDNDDIPSNLEGAKPKKIDGYTYVYDGAGRIEKIKTEVGEWKYTYEENLLTAVSHRITKKDIADGSVMIRFEHKGNKIIVESTAEPDFRIYREEIELESNNPVRITDAGVFEYTAEGRVKKDDGSRFSTLSYETPERLLSRVETYSLPDSNLVKTITYEYDQSPGVMSQVTVPSWYLIYRDFDYYTEIPRFLNYKMNIVKRTITDHLTNTTETTEYTFEYNKIGLPTTILSERSGQKMTIKY